MVNSVLSPLTCGFMKLAIDVMSSSSTHTLNTSEKREYLRESYGTLMKMVNESQISVTVSKKLHLLCENILPL